MTSFKVTCTDNSFPILSVNYRNMLCCLCCVSLQENHRKRRRLHGRSCEIARTVLLEMSSFELLYSETKSPNALLCLVCDKPLQDFRTTETKLEQLRTKITEMLGWLHRSSSSSGLPSLAMRSSCKRPRIDNESQLQQEFSTEM